MRTGEGVFMPPSRKPDYGLGALLALMSGVYIQVHVIAAYMAGRTEFGTQVISTGLLVLALILWRKQRAAVKRQEDSDD